MSIPLDRPPAAEAGPELLVLQKWEAFTGWFLNHTARWPKAARFTLTQRLDNHALDVTEMLVQARYERRLRTRLLHEANLRLERMRFLCRIAVVRRDRIASCGIFVCLVASLWSLWSLWFLDRTTTENTESTEAERKEHHKKRTSTRQRLSVQPKQYDPRRIVATSLRAPSAESLP